MKAAQIRALTAQGQSADSIYEMAAGNLSLYGVAFFGHKFQDRKRTKRARAKLQRVWKQILKIAA